MQRGPEEAKGSMPMGILYSGGREHRSATVKLRCVTRFIQLLMKKLPTIALTSDGLLPADSWRWHEFVDDHASIPEAVKPPAEEPPLPLVIEDEEKPVEEESPITPVSSVISSAESEDQSPSASDNSADGEDLVGVWADPSMAEAMGWFVQGRKVHLIREERFRSRPPKEGIWIHCYPAD